MRSFPESSYWLIRCGNGLFWAVQVGCRQGRKLSAQTVLTLHSALGQHCRKRFSMWNRILRNSVNLSPEHPPCKYLILRLECEDNLCPFGFRGQRMVCCYSVAQLCLMLYDPMDYSVPDFPALHYFLEFAQTHVYRVDDGIE